MGTLHGLLQVRLPAWMKEIRMERGSAVGCCGVCLHRLAACTSAWPHRNQQSCQSSAGGSRPDVTPRRIAAAGFRLCNPPTPQEGQCPTSLFTQG